MWVFSIYSSHPCEVKVPQTKRTRSKQTIEPPEIALNRGFTDSKRCLTVTSLRSRVRRFESCRERELWDPGL